MVVSKPGGGLPLAWLDIETDGDGEEARSMRCVEKLPGGAVAGAYISHRYGLALAVSPPACQGPWRPRRGSPENLDSGDWALEAEWKSGVSGSLGVQTWTHNHHKIHLKVQNLVMFLYPPKTPPRHALKQMKICALLYRYYAIPNSHSYIRATPVHRDVGIQRF